MHTHLKHQAPRRNGRGLDNNGALFTWAVTFVLLSLVSAIFALSGTLEEPAGLYGRIATVGFLVLALLMFFIGRNLRSPR